MGIVTEIQISRKNIDIKRPEFSQAKTMSFLESIPDYNFLDTKSFFQEAFF